jgi:2-iminobutanoate/2-iminopropanoate deaminase
MKTSICTTHAAPAIGPYSQAISANGFLFISGQVPIDSEGNLIDGTIEDQTHQVMKNLQAILEAAGLNFDNVVKTDIFIKDMNDFTKINEVYASYLKEPYPARATVEVARLPKDVKVEISMIAVKD